MSPCPTWTRARCPWTTSASDHGRVALPYEAMRVFYAERLLNTISQVGRTAEQHGLTELEWSADQ